MSCASRLVFGLSLLLIAASTAAGQTADNVLLVINDASPASVEIGEYYAERRQLRDDHIVRLTTSTAETIQRAAFEQTIQAPVATWLSEHRLQDTILYVVLTKGVPIRVFGTGGRDGTVASVDSELTLLYRRMVGTPTTLRGRLPNPYFLGDRPVEAAEPFTRFLSDLYLVTRLDGFTVEDVRGLIDRGMHPATSGQVVLDQRGLPFDPGGDGWMLQAADRLGGTTPGVDVVLEDSPRVAWAEGRVLGYYSWGSNDPANQTRHPDLRFAPGAIGGLFVSTDGRTFAEPPADWQPGVSGRPPGVFGTGSQTLAGDLIRAGMTGLAAHVEEPYLDGTIRPQVLFPAYLSGRSLAESFYLAMPYLSWQTIVIGDPLCAPFRATPLPTSRLARGIDPDTELPALFSERRIERLSADGHDPEALARLLRAEVRLSQGDAATSEALLREAASIDPGLTSAALQLAALHEQRAEYEEALTWYRKVVDADPQDVIALNNIAFALAVRLDRPQDALPFAERAARLSSAADVLDTLGWIHHLLGDNEAAAPILDRATAGSTGNGQIWLHAAIVHAALGELASARRELATALKIDPDLVDRPEVRALRQRIGGATVRRR